MCFFVKECYQVLCDGVIRLLSTATRIHVNHVTEAMSASLPITQPRLTYDQTSPTRALGRRPKKFRALFRRSCMRKLSCALSCIGCATIRRSHWGGCVVVEPAKSSRVLPLRAALITAWMACLGSPEFCGSSAAARNAAGRDDGSFCFRQPRCEKNDARS